MNSWTEETGWGTKNVRAVKANFQLLRRITCFWALRLNYCVRSLEKHFQHKTPIQLADLEHCFQPSHLMKESGTEWRSPIGGLEDICWPCHLGFSVHGDYCQNWLVNMTQYLCLLDLNEEHSWLMPIMRSHSGYHSDRAYVLLVTCFFHIMPSFLSGLPLSLAFFEKVQTARSAFTLCVKMGNIQCNSIPYVFVFWRQNGKSREEQTHQTDTY